MGGLGGYDGASDVSVNAALARNKQAARTVRCDAYTTRELTDFAGQRECDPRCVRVVEPGRPSRQAAGVGKEAGWWCSRGGCLTECRG